MRRTALAALAAALTTAALAGCGAGRPPAPIVVTETVTVAPPTPPTGAEETVAASAVAASWTMPDLVGAGLQEAQDAIQQLTGYGIAVTTSHDATGADRMQVSDRNWKVCTQNVPAGTTITSGTRIDFGAVKLDENC